jgi:hypothetical protein
MEDKIKKVPKPVITASEYQQMISDAESARELLTDKRFTFFHDFLRQEKETIVSDFVNNKIKKTIVVQKGPQEDHQIVFERWEQEAELSGQFKFIFKLIAKLQEIEKMPSEAETARAKGKVTIET